MPEVSTPSQDPDRSHPKPEPADLRALIASAPRILLIGDRDRYNLDSLLQAQRLHPAKLNLCGMFVPGCEIDAIFMEAMNEPGHALPRNRIHGERNAQKFMDATFADDNRSFSYLHLPYDPKRLRAEPDYRREYSLQLAGQAERLAPDLIFLANFKAILDRAFVERFAGKIVNVHPSVLPLLKGFKPELEAAVKGRYPQALGYTFHLVSPELDGGPTIAQQSVPVIKYSSDEETYEYARLAVIRAQALHVAPVLALVASATERKTLSDGEAFAAEGRFGFEHSDEYRDSLNIDYQHWLASHGDSGIGFERWQDTIRVPYQRIVFKAGDKFQTAEQILSISAQARPDTGLQTEVTASFIISPSDQRGATEIFTKIMAEVESGERTRSAVTSVHLENAPMAPPGHMLCIVKGPCGISLRSALEKYPEVHSVNLTLLPVGVSNPRRAPRALL